MKFKASLFYVMPGILLYIDLLFYRFKN